MVSLPVLWIVVGLRRSGRGGSIENREGIIENIGADILDVRLDYWSRSFLFRRCRRGRGNCVGEGKRGRGKLRVRTQ